MKNFDEVYQNEGFLSEIINAITSGIFVTDLDHKIMMINSAGAEMVGRSAGDCFDRKCFEIFNTPMCQTESCTCRIAISTNKVNFGQTVLHHDDKEIAVEYSSRPLKNYKGEIIGCVENFTDITNRLDQQRIIQEQQKKLLQKRDEDIRHLQDEVMELSTPVMEIWDGILALPLIGTLDSHRARIATERLLEAIERTRAPFVIIDITGVPTVDTEVANHIIQTVNAARLMGSKAILTGVGPHIARIIAQGTVDMGNLTVQGRMTDGLHLAISELFKKKEAVDLINAMTQKDK